MSEQVLDDQNILTQRDPDGALSLAAHDYEQIAFQPEIKNGEHDGRELQQVVITGMGGSALAALLAHAWLKSELHLPLDVVRSYSLPAYIGPNTLVIASSYSGNTEETLSAYAQAKEKGAQLAVIAAGGKLIEEAIADGVTYGEIPSGMQPRMALIYNLQVLLAILEHFGVVSERVAHLQNLAPWLEEQTKNWLPDVPTEKNEAKQVALTAVGKTAVFYGGELTAPIAYKWKISWNETGKNLAFWNEYSEFNHNEFMGWTSHPVEKPFVIFDLISHLEHPQILKRFEISDRLLSGKRPKANIIELKGDTIIEQLLYGVVMADFASIYLAILNNVNPVPVVLIEKLKKEL